MEETSRTDRVASLDLFDDNPDNKSAAMATTDYVEQATSDDQETGVSAADLLGSAEADDETDRLSAGVTDQSENDSKPVQPKIHKPSRAKKLSRRLVAPEGSPEPTNRLSKLEHNIWAHNWLGNNNPQPPRVSKKEYWAWQAMVEAEDDAYQAKLDYIDQLVTTLRGKASKTRRRIASRNSKGGSSKSPTAANLATVLDWAIDMLVLMIDANDNDGSQHLQLGIPRGRTKSLLYVMNHMDAFVSVPQLYDELATPGKRGKGVLLVASPPGSTHAFDGQAYIETVLQLALLVHSIVIDTGNGNTVGQNERSVAVATDMVVPTMADDPESFEKAISTLAAHYNQGHMELVKRSFIVVNATQPGDTKAMYLQKLAVAAAELKVEDILATGSDDDTHIKTTFTLEDLNITADKVCLIPFDQHIKQRGVADVDLMQTDTLIAYLELLVAIYSQDAPAHQLQTSVTFSVLKTRSDTPGEARPDHVRPATDDLNPPAPQLVASATS